MKDRQTRQHPAALESQRRGSTLPLAPINTVVYHNITAVASNSVTLVQQATDGRL